MRLGPIQMPQTPQQCVAGMCREKQRFREPHWEKSRYPEATKTNR